jgi:hypothetical protein
MDYVVFCQIGVSSGKWGMCGACAAQTPRCAGYILQKLTQKWYHEMQFFVKAEIPPGEMEDGSLWEKSSSQGNKWHQSECGTSKLNLCFLPEPVRIF